MKAVIVGAGGIGRELAEDLARREDNDITLVDVDEERCDELAANLDALVIHGDGTDPEILMKAQVDDADALVATTGSDALNTVIAMLGRHMGVGRIVVKLDGIGLRAACHELGVTEIIAPKIAAAARIVSVLYGFHSFDLSVLARGSLQLIEVSADRLAGKKLSAAELSGDVVVMAVMRGDRVFLARGHTKIEADDRLLMLAEGEEAAEEARNAMAVEEG